MFSKKSVTCFQQDRSNGIWPANELTKSFCLRPTTVFVLFYFSTVMAISVIPAIYYYYTLCSLVDFDYLERENVLFFSCFFTTGYKTCFNVFFYYHIDVCYNYGYEPGLQRDLVMKATRPLYRVPYFYRASAY